MAISMGIGAYFILFHIFMARGIRLEWKETDPQWMRDVADNVLFKFSAPVWFPICWIIGAAWIEWE